MQIMHELVLYPKDSSIFYEIELYNIGTYFKLYFFKRLFFLFWTCINQYCKGLTIRGVSAVLRPLSIHSISSWMGFNMALYFTSIWSYRWWASCCNTIAILFSVIIYRERYRYIDIYIHDYTYIYLYISPHSHTHTHTYIYIIYVYIYIYVYYTWTFLLIDIISLFTSLVQRSKRKPRIMAPKSPVWSAFVAFR